MPLKINKLLKGHQLRVTNCRKDVLDTFLHKEMALSHSDLEEVLQEDYDRVTIYRTLKTFLDHDLIHKVLDDTGVVKYALCSHGASEEHHDHEHVHFKCEKCGKTQCIEEISLPQIPLPKGFVGKEMSLLIHGICDKCS